MPRKRSQLQGRNHGSADNHESTNRARARKKEGQFSENNTYGSSHAGRTRSHTNDQNNRNARPLERMSVNRSYKPKADMKYTCRATQRTPQMHLLTDPNEPVAVDVEFQQHHWHGSASGIQKLGRIAIVNTHGDVIYDTYVLYPRADGLEVKVPAQWRGFPISKKDLMYSTGAQPLEVVEPDLRAIFTGRPIIGFGMSNDRIAIGEELLSLGALVRDVQKLYTSFFNQPPGLQSLIAEHFSHLDLTAHDPRDDAKATMLLDMRINPYQGRRDFPVPLSAHQQQGSKAITQYTTMSYHIPVPTLAEASGADTMGFTDNDSGFAIDADADEVDGWGGPTYRFSAKW